MPPSRAVVIFAPRVVEGILQQFNALREARGTGGVIQQSLQVFKVECHAPCRPTLLFPCSARVDCRIGAGGAAAWVNETRVAPACVPQPGRHHERTPCGPTRATSGWPPRGLANCLPHLALCWSADLRSRRKALSAFFRRGGFTPPERDAMGRLVRLRRQLGRWRTQNVGYSAGIWPRSSSS